MRSLDGARVSATRGDGTGCARRGACRRGRAGRSRRRPGRGVGRSRPAERGPAPSTRPGAPERAARCGERARAARARRRRRRPAGRGTGRTSRPAGGRRAARGTGLRGGAPGRREESQKLSRRRPRIVLAESEAETPAAHAPATSAPALEPETEEGTSRSSSSTVSTPVWAKKPKNPEDIVSPNGASRSQSASVIADEEPGRSVIAPLPELARDTSIAGPRPHTLRRAPASCQPDA